MGKADPIWRDDFQAAEITDPERIHPKGDRVLIRPVKQRQKTDGGIFIPDTAQHKEMRGVILKVGPGKLLDNGSHRRIPLEEGETVLFNQYAGKFAGTSVRGGEHGDFVLVELEDVIATVS